MAVDSMTGLPVASREALRGARRTAAAMYSRSRREIPEATVWVDADVTALVQLREELKTRDAVVPGMLAFVARFVTAGLARYPQLNSRFDDEPVGGEVVTFAGVNLGFAAQTDRGLVVPAVEHAELLTARQLDAEIRRLTAAARSGTASTAELGRGTFTLNNYGVFGVDGSAAILNYPQAAMLGLGRVLERPWVVAGELAVRQVAQLTLVFDHRVCDGETAAGFLRFVADSLDNPVMALADL
jgi:2-oxoisovalerate dehydrogenase E2 component (dihydrolipoyl transacylase)